MRIYLGNQERKFSEHLDGLKRLQVIPYDLTKLRSKISSVRIETPFEKLDRGPMLRYEIFPRNIMGSLPQWIAENRRMQVSDNIIQQVQFPPFKNFSQKLIFGVRLDQIIEEEHRFGYSYETLQGHVEVGKSTFTFEKAESHTIFRIETYSAPSNFLLKLLGPIFSVPYQAFCTRQAMKNVKRAVE